MGMNDSIYDIYNFTLSDLSQNQMQNLKLKMTATNPKLPRYIIENIEYHLQYYNDGTPPTDDVPREQKQITPSGVLLHLQRVYPNIRINHLITISRIHLCHDFATYLQYLMWQLANDKDI